MNKKEEAIVIVLVVCILFVSFLVFLDPATTGFAVCESCVQCEAECEEEADSCNSAADEDKDSCNDAADEDKDSCNDECDSLPEEEKDACKEQCDSDYDEASAQCDSDYDETSAQCDSDEEDCLDSCEEEETTASVLTSSSGSKDEGVSEHSGSKNFKGVTVTKINIKEPVKESLEKSTEESIQVKKEIKSEPIEEFLIDRQSPKKIKKSPESKNKIEFIIDLFKIGFGEFFRNFRFH